MPGSRANPAVTDSAAAGTSTPAGSASTAQTPAGSATDSQPPAGSTQTSTTASTSASRHYASFRLPIFAPEEAELWLVQVGCAFDVAGIDDETVKFKLLVANLPTTVASQVRDVITQQSGDYTALSDALRQRLAQSRASRLESLLRHQQLGDRKPSQLLRDMRGQLVTAGNSACDSGLLRTLFFQRLPQSARAALSLLSEATPLGELAEAADRFMEASLPTVTVAAVAAAPLGPPPSNQVPLLPTQVSGTAGDSAPDLTSAIQGLVAVINRLDCTNRRLEEAVFDRPRRPRSATPGRGARASSTSRTRRSGPSDSGYCWYHRRFGAEAHKCVEPCSWSASGNAQA